VSVLAYVLALAANVDERLYLTGINRRQVMSEATDSVTSLAARGHEILTGCVDGYMRRYDVRMGEMVSDCLVHPIICVRFTHDGNCVLATCIINTVCVCVCVCEVFMLGFPAKYVYGHCVCGAWVFVLGGVNLCQSFLQNMCMDSVCVC